MASYQIEDEEPQRSDWRTRFEELFTVDCSGEAEPKIKCRHFKTVDNPNAVINFISAERENVRREVLEEIEKALPSAIDKHTPLREQLPSAKGHNSCLYQIKEVLARLKNE